MNMHLFWLLSFRRKNNQFNRNCSVIRGVISLPSFLLLHELDLQKNAPSTFHTVKIQVPHHHFCNTVIVYFLKAVRQVWMSVTPEVQAVSSKSKVACASGLLSRYDCFETSYAVFLFLHGNITERHIHRQLAHPPHCHPLEHCFITVA